MAWISKRRLSAEQIEKLGLAEFRELERESQYWMIPIDMLVDLVEGAVTQGFTEALKLILHTAARTAGERKVEGLMKDLQAYRRENPASTYTASDVFQEAIRSLEAEGIGRVTPYTAIGEWTPSTPLALLKGYRVADSIDARIQRALEERGIDARRYMPRCYIARGCLAGVTSGILGRSVRLEESAHREKAGNEKEVCTYVIL